jgi:hypothetical protein
MWVKIAIFLGTLLAKLIPAIGAEIRKNNTVKHIGADRETKDAIDLCITDSNGKRVRMDEAGDSGPS